MRREQSKGHSPGLAGDPTKLSRVAAHLSDYQQMASFPNKRLYESMTGCSCTELFRETDQHCGSFIFAAVKQDFSSHQADQAVRDV
jgi:hypothetical protein